MYKIQPKRNDICPCGSEKKYKKCCINKKLEFYEVTDIDFMFVREFNANVPEKNKSNPYNQVYAAYMELEKICIEYKNKILKSIKEEISQDVAYKYIFKKTTHEEEDFDNEIYLCGIKEIDDMTKFEKDKINDNIRSALVVIAQLHSFMIPNELYEMKDAQILEDALTKNNINLIYEEEK